MVVEEGVAGEAEEEVVEEVVVEADEEVVEAEEAEEEIVEEVVVVVVLLVVIESPVFGLQAGSHLLSQVSSLPVLTSINDVQIVPSLKTGSVLKTSNIASNSMGVESAPTESS